MSYLKRYYVSRLYGVCYIESYMVHGILYSHMLYSVHCLFWTLHVIFCSHFVYFSLPGRVVNPCIL